MTFKIFRAVIAVIILPIMFIPLLVLGAITSKDWEGFMDWWKDYFWA